LILPALDTTPKHFKDDAIHPGIGVILYPWNLNQNRKPI